MALDDALHLVEVAAHHAPERFGVEPLAKRGRAGDVGEDDRYGLSDLGPWRQGLRELYSADAAIAKALGVLLAALWANGHAQRVGMHAIRFQTSAQDERGRCEPGVVCAPTSSAHSVLRSKPQRPRRGGGA